MAESVEDVIRLMRAWDDEDELMEHYAARIESALARERAVRRAPIIVGGRELTEEEVEYAKTITPTRTVDTEAILRVGDALETYGDPEARRLAAALRKAVGE